MYIFEIFYKWLNKNKRGTSLNPDNRFNGSEGIQSSEDDAEFCEHNFMPLDSTGEVLSCIKCGFIVKKKNK